MEVSVEEGVQAIPKGSWNAENGFLFPVLIILVFPFAANMEVRNFSLVIVDSDQSDQSALLTEKCASSGYFKIREVTESPSDAQTVMDRGGADAILTISSGFARYLESDRDTNDPLPVGIKVNTVNGTRGSIGSQYLNAFVTEYVASVSGTKSQGGAAGTRFDTRETISTTRPLTTRLS